MEAIGDETGASDWYDRFVAFGSQYLRPGVIGIGLDGQLVALFVIVLAAAEAAVALAITLNFYNNHSTVDVDQADELKG